MDITIRSYRGPEDFKLIGDFLIENYQHCNKDGNWFQPTWEYIHCHPYLDESLLDRIGIWEKDGKIIGVVNYEFVMGEAFFQLHPHYAELKAEMLDYAEKHFSGIRENGTQYLNVYINDFDLEFENIVKSRGYGIDKDGYHRPMCMLEIPGFIPEIELPEGFRIESLREDNDLHKIHRVLWRGFNHKGEPPEEGIKGRIKMQSGPNFRKELTIVVEAPDKNFASFSGMWYEAINKIAYVEPVATDPDYRRMGLGKAAVLEGIRRCAGLGANVVYVGSDQKFYLNMGFRRIHSCRSWIKEM